jgi:uncharacterized protein YkwD
MKLFIFLLLSAWTLSCSSSATMGTLNEPVSFFDEIDTDIMDMDIANLEVQTGDPASVLSCMAACFPQPDCPDVPEEPVPPEEPEDEEEKNPSLVQSQMLSLMNMYRAGVLASSLILDKKLNCAAERHALDIGDNSRCSHTGTDGSSPWDRAGGCGTSALGEIVACGQTTAAGAIQAWYASEGHKNLMLNAGHARVGLAMHKNYWVALFK